MSIFVLIHGAWHGAWCWDKLIPIMQSMGHKVIAPDLPGSGNDQTPIEEVTFSSYVEKIKDVINNVDDKVILVGHSMGGIVISAVAEQIPNKISSLVYLCAFMPKINQSLMDIVKDQPKNHLELEFSEDYKYSTVKQEAIEGAFLNTCSPEDVVLVKNLLRPQTMSAFQAKFDLTEENYGQVAKIYIECIQDNAISIDLQRSMMKDVSKVYSLDTDHSPFLSSPDLLGQILNEIGSNVPYSCSSL